MATMIRDRLLAGAALLLSLASCAKDRPSDVSGFWQGSLGGEVAWLSLMQSGSELTGSLNGMALLGQVHGSSFDFTLNGGGLCAVAARGSGSMESLADRERIHLQYAGADCGGAPVGATGQLDRLRCATDQVACGPQYSAALVPYCANLQIDPHDCGQCGTWCESYQVCLSGGCQVPACTGSPRLEAPQEYPALGKLMGIVTGDVDGDGAQDLVAGGWDAASGGGAVAVLRGDGRGGLAAPILTAMALEPLTVALGDLDGDGTLDAVAFTAIFPGAQEIDVLLGNGDGTFRAGQAFQVTGEGNPIYGVPLRLVALADLDRDGRLDLVARSGPAPAVQVRLGVGDGSFGPAVEYAVAWTPGALLAADLDGDGAPDLVAVPHVFSSAAASVLLGNGDGTFRAALDIEGMYGAHDVAAADLDEDGTLDLLLAGGNGAFGGVVALLGRGDGTFAPDAMAIRASGIGLAQAVTDLDGDGHLDVAVTLGTELDAALGHGDGTFAELVRFPIPWEGAYTLASADLDGDGQPDLVTGSYLSTLRVFLACGPATP